MKITRDCPRCHAVTQRPAMFPNACPRCGHTSTRSARKLSANGLQRARLHAIRAIKSLEKIPAGEGRVWDGALGSALGLVRDVLADLDTNYRAAVG